MIPKENRFHGHNAVSKVKGRSRHGEHLSVRVAERQKGPSRVAVVVSKKVDNRAVVRNRIRRRIYEAVRTQGYIDGRSIDVVIYVKSADLAALPARELRSELSRLF